MWHFFFPNRLPQIRLRSLQIAGQIYFQPLVRAVRKQPTHRWHNLVPSPNQTPYWSQEGHAQSWRLDHIWLVVYLPLWNIWKPVGMMKFPNILENNIHVPKPPTRYGNRSKQKEIVAVVRISKRFRRIAPWFGWELWRYWVWKYPEQTDNFAGRAHMSRSITTCWVPIQLVYPLQCMTRSRNIPQVRFFASYIIYI